MPTGLIPLGPAARYHLLLAHGGDRETFDELVAASGVVREAGGWFGTGDAPLSVSSVEADARLARWSRQTGGLGLRITRTDPTRFWLAVHHAGQRLFVMVHYEPGPEATPSDEGFSPELGHDPLYELLAAQGEPPLLVRQTVADRRAEQLAASLAQGEIAVNVDALAELLGRRVHADDPVEGLLDRLGCGPLIQLTAGLADAEGSKALSSLMNRFLARTLLTGCLVPSLVAVVLFVSFTRLAMRGGLHPLLTLLLGVGAAWSGIWAAREVGKRLGGPDRWRQRLNLAWAADRRPSAARIRPTAQALDTWGGLFYLLRDIAFFAGIDRPSGPMALYIEAWGLGPPGLVIAINRAAGQDDPAEPLLDAAQALLALRDRLIARHLAGEPIDAGQVREDVRTILRPAVRGS